ncbi:hypothetical protein SCLCIDRAFT_26675 [Scleroderma citrinum Foug A]|uniref:Histidine-specific methyltransferase SAM-dependent domain-containing protein n=1 Tax=Scleroderma citrinum Foug A TaxID=1036808 RepID=A0A0C3DHZ4_9AGAM|nr:hypothetical protein SCLCIDRAFT_26675 [Scleroderma citrinum Foug A]
MSHHQGAVSPEKCFQNCCCTTRTFVCLNKSVITQTGDPLKVRHVEANYIPEGTLLLELGASTLRRTALLFGVIKGSFALDLDKLELRKLASSSVTSEKFFLLRIGLLLPSTRSHNLEAVRPAYEDRAGVTCHFAVNALGSIDDLFNAKVMDVSCYSPYYNEVQDRNEVYFRRLKQTQVCTPSEELVLIHEVEYNRFVYSHKYDHIERQLLWSSANARAEREWITD